MLKSTIDQGTPGITGLTQEEIDLSAESIVIAENDEVKPTRRRHHKKKKHLPSLEILQPPTSPTSNTIESSRSLRPTL